MTTLQFFNENSTAKINQSEWEEDIYIHDYNSKKSTDIVETNELYIEKECEFELIHNNDTFFKKINKLEIDTIDKICLKIKMNSEIYRVLFASYHISIGISSYTEMIKLVDSRLLDLCLISYLNNHLIECDENTIIIPIIQFNHITNGYLYRLINNRIMVNFRDYSNETFNLVEKKIIESIKIIFYGKKYYNFNLKDNYYKPMDMNWWKFNYNSNGNYISNVSTKYQFITFSLIKQFDLCGKLSINELNEIMDNQPEIEEVSFLYQDKLPWIYDINYMKKITLFGVNIYILPLFPEFINLENILYSMKNSSNSINPYIDRYKIKIKTNIINDQYMLYLTFFGEWID